MRGAITHDLIVEATNKLSEFRELNVAPENIVVTDKIYLSDTPTASMQTGMIGMYGTLHS
jgi:hypothetical protein